MWFMKNLIGLKALRQDVTKYARRVAQGESFIVLKKSRPIFKITPVEDGAWEEVIDFTKIRRGGVRMQDVLSRL